jgi:DNA-binding transcriptional LysR family regulator
MGIMNIDDLTAFVEIARAGGVHAASERLHKTQSAISKALRRLENKLGLQLVDRTGYRATATDAGAAILRHAEAILGKVRQLESFALALAQGQEQRIRLAVHSSLADSEWTQLVAADR